MTKLRQQMIRDLRIRGRSRRTEEGYVRTVSDLAKYYRRSPDSLTTSEVQNYLYYLIENRNLAISSVTVAGHALRFFYHVTLGREKVEFDIPIAKKPKQLPQILSQKEILPLFEAASNLKHKALLMTVYGAGLRVSEVVHLKISDIDSGQMALWVRNGKGGKDRGVPLSKRLLKTLRHYWVVYKPRTWLFPYSKDWRQPLTRSGAQYMFYATLKRSGIQKKCSIHTLRHAYATHLLEAGKDIRTIQKLMGHKSLSSTMIYIHLAIGTLLATDSPLDLLDFDEKGKAHERDNL